MSLHNRNAEILYHLQLSTNVSVIHARAVERAITRSTVTRACVPLDIRDFTVKPVGNVISLLCQ